MANRRKHRTYAGKETSSVFKGVTWHKKYSKWYSRLGLNSKKVDLGYFYNQVDAAKAYNAAAKFYFGAFAVLNVIEEKKN
jgi:hypothetical protein